MRRALILALAVVTVPAFAQDDDDLPALPSAPKKAAPKAKTKAAPKKKQPEKQPVADDDLPALPPQKGDLVVKLASALKGAKLLIDDKEIGNLPQPPQSIQQGEHTVMVRRLGFAPFTKKVNVAPNKSNEVMVSLEATAAVLTVSSDVAGAQVFVNGRMAGTAPLVELEVPPGEVEIAVKKDGYHDGAQKLALKAGRDYPIEVKLGAPISSTVVAVTEDRPVNTDLTPSGSDRPTEVTNTDTPAADNTPVVQKWWFWTAVVVVVAGVAIGGGVAAANSGTVELGKNDFTCGGMRGGCDGWVNAIVPIKRH